MLFIRQVSADNPHYNDVNELYVAVTFALFYLSASLMLKGYMP